MSLVGEREASPKAPPSRGVAPRPRDTPRAIPYSTKPLPDSSFLLTTVVSSTRNFKHARISVCASSKPD